MRVNPESFRGRLFNLFKGQEPEYSTGATSFVRVSFAAMARRAIALLPESKDSIEGPDYATTLAFVCAQTGEAISLLAHLLTTPSTERVTLAHLRLSWEWDPIRNDPRFQKILEGPEAETVYQ